MEDSHDDDGEVPVRDGQEKGNEIASNIKADVNEQYYVPFAAIQACSPLPHILKQGIYSHADLCSLHVNDKCKAPLPSVVVFEFPWTSL